jgi:uncharacterized membrane protein
MHALLTCAVVASIGVATAAQVAIAAVLAAPLALAIPGLLHRRRNTYQRLAVVLVLYAGAASVEVIATSGAGYAAALSLLAALTELALLLMLIRRPARLSHRE